MLFHDTGVVMRTRHAHSPVQLDNLNKTHDVSYGTCCVVTFVVMPWSS